MPQISVNGEEREVAAGASLVDLTAELGLANTTVAIELNRSVVPRASHSDTTLSDGDRVEIVTIVGGG